MAIPLWKPAPIVHVRMRASESAEDSRPTMEDAARITSLIQEYCARKDYSQGRVFRDRDDSPSWNEFVRLLQDVKLRKLTPDQFLHYIDQVFREEQKIKADIHWLMTPVIQEPPSSSSSTID
ncbi:hypothetical protein FRC02_012053 [Tulasnella sp. 418]|nr:hypothetical protein FRC02_012053 [Tulasnella sp. 418]